MGSAMSIGLLVVHLKYHLYNSGDLSKWFTFFVSFLRFSLWCHPVTLATNVLGLGDGGHYEALNCRQGRT